MGMWLSQTRLMYQLLIFSISLLILISCNCRISWCHFRFSICMVKKSFAMYPPPIILTLLLAVGQTSLIQHFLNSAWNSSPVNTLPGSSTQHCGHEEYVDQHCTNFCITWSKSFLSILTSFTQLVTVSITVNASNICSFQQTCTLHGPISSTKHSLYGVDRILRSGKNPYPLPSNLFFGQELQ